MQSNVAATVVTCGLFITLYENAIYENNKGRRQHFKIHFKGLNAVFDPKRQSKQIL